MIIPSDIVRHLKTYLPIFTDKFTELLTITSATIIAGGELTVVAPAHGMAVGRHLVGAGGTLRNPLSATVLSGSNVLFTTKYEHDLIKPSQTLDDTILKLAGFGDVWDGEHTIVDILSRKKFTIALPAGETTAPAVDETQYLKEDRSAGVTGVLTVATVPDVNSFTIDISDVPDFPPGSVDDLKLITGFRIAAASDFKRAQAVYTKQSGDDAYLFVIMTDGDVSKDRHTMNDGVAGFVQGDLSLLRLLRNFSTVIFLPTGDDLSGIDAQDEAYGVMYEALIATLFGFSESGQAIRYGAVPVGDGQTEYNSAYYAHVYDWQIPDTISYQDGFLQQRDVAFRDIAQTLKVFNDAEAEMKTNINLDTE